MENRYAFALESLTYWKERRGSVTDPKEIQQCEDYISYYNEECHKIEVRTQQDIEKQHQRALRLASIPREPPRFTPFELMLSPLYLFECVLSAMFLVIMWGVVFVIGISVIWALIGPYLNPILALFGV